MSGGTGVGGEATTGQVGRQAGLPPDKDFRSRQDLRSRFAGTRSIFPGVPSDPRLHGVPMPLAAWLLLVVAVGLGLTLELAFYRARRRDRRAVRTSAGGGA